ncbi:MAG: glycosyltransferase family 2 protein [Vicinamibacteria bacterium]
MPNARLSAVVVTHDSRADVGACLESLLRSSRPPDEILVVDNDSRDGTADLVRRDFPGAVVVDYWDNPGFGEAHNRAFRVARGERFFLLNPDATAAPDCIERLERAMDEAPGTGVAVPKVLLSREPSVLNSAGLHVNGVGYGWDRGYLERDAGQYDEAGPVIAGSGCALLVSAEMVSSVGGFDAAFFLYYEDLDLCLRSWLAGFPVRYVPGAVARHRMKVTGRSSHLNDYLDHRNRLRALLKCLPPGRLVRALARSARFDGSEIVASCRRRDPRRAGRRVAAWAWNLARLPETLARRRRARARAGHDDWTALLTPGDGAPRPRAAVPGYPVAFADAVEPSRLPDALRMGADETGLGLGWHALERAGGVAFRWSCGYGIAYLRTPGVGPARLEIDCFSARDGLVEVEVDGAPCGPLRVAPGPLETRSLAVSCLRPWARVEIRPESTLVPAESLPGARDHRTLGLAVASLRLAAPPLP